MNAPEEVAKKSPLRTAETGLIVAVLALMVVFPLYTTAARLITGSTPTGTLVFVQHLTIWAGFVGALIATGGNAHLSLATQEFLPEGRMRTSAHFFAQTVAAAATALLGYAGALMIQADKQTGSMLFSVIPQWWSEIIMPVALAFMAMRCILAAGPTWWQRAASLALVACAFALDLLSDHASPLMWPLVLIVLVAVLLGAPIYVGLSGLGMALFFAASTPIATVPSELMRLVESPTLPAIPLLTLCGFVLAEGGASTRLVRAARSVVGWMPGGIAIMVVLVCALFTTLTGGSGVTIIALGGLVLPILIKEGYPEGFSLGLVTASGSLGLLLPPSLPVILYGVVAHQSADQLYIGGLLPSLLLILITCAYSVYVGVKSKTQRASFSVREVGAAMWLAKWELAIPVLLVTILFSGKATIVEASAIAAGLSVFVEVVVFRDLHWKRDMPRVVASAGKLMGAVVIVLGTAMGLTSYLVDAEIPTRLLSWVTQNVHSPYVFLLALNVILLVLGSVLEIYSAIVILSPLIVPLGSAFGINPVHLGVIFLSNLELGFLFPPVGLNLLLSSSRFKKPLPAIYRVTLPFLIMLAVGVLVITYVPALTLTK